MCKHSGNDVNQWCRRCQLFCVENVEHILFDCTATNMRRQDRWNFVKLKSIPNLIDGIERMASEDKVMFILNAFNCEYVPDWEVTYTAILNFVNNMYENHVRE